MHLKHLRHIPLIFGLVVLAIALTVMVTQTFKRQVPSVVTSSDQPETPFTLSSSAFDPGAAIPNLYTCGGSNISPPLLITNAPQNTTNFAIVARDSNGTGDDKIHWIVWNIPSDTLQIAPQALPAVSVQGTTDDKKTTYSGPCPPSGKLTYFTFELYALNDHINLESDATYDSLVAAMNGKVLGRALLIGTAGKPTP